MIDLNTWRLLFLHAAELRKYRCTLASPRSVLFLVGELGGELGTRGFTELKVAVGGK